MARRKRETLPRGGDTEVVTEPRVTRSRSKEITFADDLTDRAATGHQVSLPARALGAEVVTAGRRVIRVAVTLRSSASQAVFCGSAPPRRRSSSARYIACMRPKWRTSRVSSSTV